MRAVEQYGVIADYYDALYGEGIPGDVDWYASACGNPPKRVLEIGCGTGRVSLGLASRGHCVLGIDISARMVEIAKDRVQGVPREVRERIRFARCEVADLVGMDEFECVIAPFNVFNEMLSEDLLRALLFNVRRLLRYGGELLGNVVSYPPEVLDGAGVMVLRHRARNLPSEQVGRHTLAIESDLFWPGTGRMERLISIRRYHGECLDSILDHRILRKYWKMDTILDILGAAGLHPRADGTVPRGLNRESGTWHCIWDDIGSARIRAVVSR